MNQFHIGHLRKEPVLSIKYQGQEKVCQEVLENSPGLVSGTLVLSLDMSSL